MKRNPAQSSAPNPSALNPRQTNSTCLFLEPRVAAHRPKGNLNLSYESFSHSFSGGCCKYAHPPQSPKLEVNSCFVAYFVAWRRLFGIPSQAFGVRFPTLRSASRRFPEDAMAAPNRSKPAPAVPDFAPYGIRLPKMADRNSLRTEPVIEVPHGLRVCGSIRQTIARKSLDGRRI